MEKFEDLAHDFSPAEVTEILIHVGQSELAPFPDYLNAVFRRELQLARQMPRGDRWFAAALAACKTLEVDADSELMRALRDRGPRPRGGGRRRERAAPAGVDGDGSVMGGASQRGLEITGAGGPGGGEGDGTSKPGEQGGAAAGDGGGAAEGEGGANRYRSEQDHVDTPEQPGTRGVVRQRDSQPDAKGAHGGDEGGARKRQTCTGLVDSTTPIRAAFAEASDNELDISYQNYEKAFAGMRPHPVCIPEDEDQARPRPLNHMLSSPQTPNHELELQNPKP